MIVIPGWLETGLFAALFVALLVTAFTRERWFLFLCGALLPTIIPRLQVGIGLDWHKLVGPMALGLFLLRRNPARVRGVTRPFGWLLGYALVVSLVWMVLEYQVLERYRFAQAMGLGPGQSTWKMPVQFGSFVMMSMALFVIPLRARNANDALAGITGFVFGCLASVGIGILLLVTTGHGTVLTGQRYIAFDVGGVDVVRLGGLGGEPKMLGASLAVLIPLALAASLFAGPATYRRYWKVALVALVGLFLTYSTSAWVAALIGVVALAGLGVLYWNQSHQTAVVRLVVGVVASLVAFQVFYGGVDMLEHIVDARFTERLMGEESDVEGQKDMFILDAFADTPRHAIWGFGLGGADLETIPYLPLKELMFERTPTAAVNIMRFFGDLGVLGLLGVLGVVATWVARALRGRDHMTVAFLVSGGAAMLFTSLVAWPEFLFLAGGLLTLLEMRRRDAGPATGVRSHARAAPPATGRSVTPC
ncbi:MAG: hypothetical protein ACQEXJ_03415 [Myxococcota bacterium]